MDVISEYTNDTSVGNKEKRQRSLLDCLDDSYYQETPSKTKHRSVPRTGSNASESSTIDSVSDMKIEECVILIESETEANDANNKIKKLKISRDDDDDAEQDAMDVEMSSNVENMCTDANSPDEIPCTPPTIEPPNIISLRTNNQKKIFDFFAQKQ